MKKYFINGALALIVGFTYTSCKNNDVDYVPIAQQKTQAYAEAFKEMIGGEVDPNQNWGFETITISEEELAAARAAVRAGTRISDKEGNLYEDKGYVIPEPIGDAERDAVLAVFNQVGAASYQSLVDWDEFFVQQVYKGTAHYKAKNNGDVLGSDHMDWLCAYDPVGTEETIYPDWNGYQKTVVTNHDDHINDFNHGDNQTEQTSDKTGKKFKGITLMVNSSTSRFGFHESESSKVYYYFRMEKINGAYYVGFDYSAEGQNPNQQVDRDYIYNDWIVKIVPGKGSDPENVGGNDKVDESTITKATYERKKLMLQGRVFCEDLAKAERRDIDFNDIVFDARIWEVSEVYKETGKSDKVNFLRYEAEICLLAAGGTIPANVANQDVHDLFGVGLTTMVNTVDVNSKVTITWGNSDTTRPVKNITFNMTELIEQNKGKISLDLIPIEVMWTTSDTNDPGIGQMKSVGRLGANVGDVPYKFCVPIGTPWASERNPITSVYSGFAEWAKDSSAPKPKWENGSEFCYDSCPDGLPIDDKYVFGYTEEKLVSSTSTTTKVVEVTLWKGSSPMVFKDNNGNKALSFSATDIKAGDLIRIYGTKSNNNAHLVLKNQENGNDGQIIDINLTDLNGHKDVEVTSEMVNRISGGTIYFTGRACTISQITKERTTTTTTN